MVINKYKTGIENFYLIISHKKNGETNSSYILVNDKNTSMVEIIPKYGPLTILNQENVLESYLDGKIIDRGNWDQESFDESGINALLSAGEIEGVMRVMKERLPNY